MPARSTLLASLARLTRAPRFHLRRVLLRRVQAIAAPVSSAAPQSDEFSLCPSQEPAMRMDGATWGSAACTEVNRYALLMGDGSVVDLPTLTPGPNHTLHLVFAATALNSGAVALKVFFVRGETFTPLGEYPAFGHGAVWADIRVGLKALNGVEGFLRLCAVGGGIALAEATVAREDRLGLVRGRGYREIRIRNEIAFFSTVYDHGMYGDKAGVDPTERGVTIHIQDAGDAAAGDAAPTADLPRVAGVAVDGFASAFDYGHHLLGRHIAAPAPDFAGRLRRFEALGRPLRVLSLCSGAARIERDLLGGVPGALELTLFDINPDLLRQAAASMPAHWQLTCIQGDINALALADARYDIILCVSALHHVVELERVVAQIAEHLEEGGEFWSIGEYIGRRGNRLWPEAYAIADGFFAALPERYRLNRLSGAVDLHLPDFDCSAGCFEGIRSDEIWSLLTRHMSPSHVYTRNCFLWRLLDLAYTDNYNLSEPVDRALIERAVALELAHYRAGGQATELHGVFTRKMCSELP